MLLGVLFASLLFHIACGYFFAWVERIRGRKAPKDAMFIYGTFFVAILIATKLNFIVTIAVLVVDIGLTIGIWFEYKKHAKKGAVSDVRRPEENTI